MFHRRLLCVLYFCLQLGQAGSHFTSQTWRFHPIIQNLTVDTYLLKSIKSASLAGCARRCSFMDTCRSFFYTTNTGNCSLHSNRFAKGAPIKDGHKVPGTKFYTDRCTASGFGYNERVDKYFKLKMDAGSNTSSRTRALGACIEDGAILGRVKTIDDLNVVTVAYKNALYTPPLPGAGQHFGFWLDATFDDAIDRFMWSDGTKVDTTDPGLWSKDGQQTTTDKHCVVMVLESKQGVSVESTFKLKPGKCDKTHDVPTELYPLCECMP